jgi:ABC-type multidrug transport system ATPase subunit/ABC-type multidrug transport system permease subunit
MSAHATAIRPAPLSIRQAAKHYGALKAVRDLSLDVPAGAIVGLLGPNGAGKTTLIRMCAGWLDADAGGVFVCGVRQDTDAAQPRRQLGIVSRDAPLLDELSVTETLRLHATLHGMPGPAAAAACAQALEEYRLQDFARRRIGVLSTGMRQRVAIACALLHRPAVLLLDEPTVGLDPDVRRHIWACLQDAARRGVAMLLATHYFDEAATLCQTVHVLRNGAITLSLAPGANPDTARQLERAYLDTLNADAGATPEEIRSKNEFVVQNRCTDAPCSIPSLHHSIAPSSATPPLSVLRQILALAWLQIKLWLRMPKHIVVSIALGASFLVLANRVMVVRLGPHVNVGVHTQSDNVALRAEREFNAFHLTMVRYPSLEQGTRDLKADRIIGLMSVPDDDPRAIRLLFGGRNPLMDRELAATLLQVASQVNTNAHRRARIIMENNRYTPEVMTTFMTAGLLPFLLLALASVNHGLFWLCDYERGTLYTMLATPVRRGALVAGRTLGSLVVMLATFAVTIVICRQFVYWDIGPQPLLWWLVVAGQMLVMCGVFFAIATLCRRFALYTDAGLILVLVLMFLSGTLMPVQTMPSWARITSFLTPTFYAVRMMRAVMLGVETVLPRDVLALAFWAAMAFAFGYWRLRTATLDHRA